MNFYWMSAGNPRYWAWLDVRLGRIWYTFQWLRGSTPWMYRSTDATPPAHDNEGRWLFGRATGVRES